MSKIVMLGTPGPERETFRHQADCFALSSVLRQGGYENRVGGAGRDRTDDLRLAKAALPQLSYSPKWVVGLSGFEPLTSRLSAVRSSQLSYRPGKVTGRNPVSRSCPGRGMCARHKPMGLPPGTEL